MPKSKMQEELEALREENERLKKGGTLSLKVSPKGAVQLNGLRRFPATYYADEWERIFAFTEEIKAFIKENKGALKEKKAS